MGKKKLLQHESHLSAVLQAGRRVAEKQPSRKEPGDAGWQPAKHEPAVCPDGQKGQRHPALYQEHCGQQEQGSESPHVLCTGDAAP